MLRHKQAILGHLIFWGYNLLFLFAGLLSFITLTKAVLSSGLNLWQFIQEVEDFIPSQIFVLLVIFVLIPPIMTILGFLLRKKSQHLLKLFFGVEMPLLGLLVLRITFLRQTSPAVWLLSAGATLSIAGLLVYLFASHQLKRPLKFIILLTQQTAVLITSYIGLLVAFFVPIFIALLIESLRYFSLTDLFDAAWRALKYDGMVAMLFSLALPAIGLLTFLFFLLTPVLTALVYWYTTRALTNELKNAYPTQKLGTIKLAFSLIFIFIFIALSLEANRNSLYQKAQQFETSDFATQQTIGKNLLQNQASLRNTLLKTYMSPYYYLTDTTMNVLTQGYRNQLKLQNLSSEGLQILFHKLAAPFIYQGKFDEDIKRAADIYQNIFDEPIQSGEQNKIRAILKNNNIQNQLRAGLLDQAEENVRLVSRKTAVSTLNTAAFAQVAIEEEYENLSRSLQEVYYEFSLPEDAVVTGLLLGPDLEFDAAAAKTAKQAPQTPAATAQAKQPPAVKPKQVFEGQVAPKGAAQKTYDQQFIRRIDPALLEQTGPRQYKLRVFPIPVKPSEADQKRLVGPVVKHQKVRITYISPINGNEIDLPTISQTRNLKTANAGTKYSYFVNEQEQKYAFVPQKLDTGSDQTTPCPTTPFSTTTSLGAVTYIPHQSNKLIGPLYNCANSYTDLPNPTNLRIAVLFDVSGSTRKTQLLEHLDETEQIAKLAGSNNIEYYLFNTQLSQSQKFDEQVLSQLKNVVSIGGTNRLKALQSIPDKYDVIMMFTDESPFEAETSESDFSPPAPIYIIHPKGLIPSYQNPLTQAVIKSGGDVVISFNQALTDYQLTKQFKSALGAENVLEVTSEGSWVIGSPNLNQLTDSKPQTADVALAKLAYRQAIYHILAQTDQQLDQLDALNKLAQDQGIVTPYSSLIALVNEQQRQDLKRFMQSADRYHTTFDVGEETLSDPSGANLLSMSAVPEPHEWVLIIASTATLLFINRHQLLRLFRHVIPAT